MKHSVSNRKELTILKIEEDVFDFRHGPSYRKTLEDLIENGNTHLIIDFSKVKAIDSCGISSILLAHKLANTAHGLAIFVALCQQIKDLLKLTCIDKQLYIFSSINEVVTLIEPAMKSRRGSKGHSKAPAFDPIEELDEEIDLIEENGLSDDAFDEDFDPDEDVNAKSATMKATGEKKRGRPKKTSTK
ncbi:MAG TPA: anti-sigma factor antagonist [Chlorobium sp.]|uniref:Anti-sigma-factor antagonist n=1 Tax=Chlorobium phaeovibrioides (strain DSM 265 / 1930) TaxID=290318 RepID=A4SE80_CHLPM|nr:anti-sigma factor antagonist [Chlorobium sp.]